MDKDIRNWTRQCESCQQSKITRHTKSPTMHFDLPSNRFESVHIDIVGPLPIVTRTHSTFPSPERYILTCIDRTTKWLEATPLVDITAVTVAQAFFENWICKFGVPLYVVSDQGSQFESELFKELSKLVGFHRLRTTAYHPQCNGMIERQHRTLKSAIMARKQNWLDALPAVLLGMRMTPLESGYSPAQLTYGVQILTPSQLISPQKKTFDSKYIQDLHDTMQKVSTDLETQKKRVLKNTKSFIPKDLKNATQVWLRIDRVRRPLEAPYSGPFKVISKNDKFFTIQLHNGNKSNVSIDRLKPVRVPESTTIPVTDDSVVDQEPASSATEEHSLDDATEEVAEDTPESTPEESSDEAIEPLPKTTRSGRQVKFNTKNDYKYF